MECGEPFRVGRCSYGGHLMKMGQRRPERVMRISALDRNLSGRARARGRRAAALTVGVVLLLLLAGPGVADEIELLTGTRFQGKFIGQTAEGIHFRVVSGNASADMKFAVEKVHAITVGGVRRVINPKSGLTPKPGPTTPPVTTKPRTDDDLLRLIREAGETRPKWLDKVPLEYPQTLDLTRKRSTGGWNAYRNLDQYLVTIINPDPEKWKGAARLLHHVLEINRRNWRAIRETRTDLAHVYGSLLGDYARGAYWLQEARSRRADDRVMLAYYYLRLGGKGLAERIASRQRSDSTTNAGVIRLWSSLGELDKALELAEIKARRTPDSAYLAAGDACRRAGKYEQAESYYRKVLEATKGSDDLKKNKKRAQTNIEGVKAVASVKLSRVRDGTHPGNAIGYGGQVHVAVVVSARRIKSVKVTRHKEKGFGTSLVDVPDQIVRKQGIKGVDAVTGATLTSEAIMNATAKALAYGMK